MFGIGWQEVLILLLILLVLITPVVLIAGLIIWMVAKNKSKSPHAPIDE
jgi:hypothetical protein